MKRRPTTSSSVSILPTTASAAARTVTSTSSNVSSPHIGHPSLTVTRLAFVCTRIGGIAAVCFLYALLNDSTRVIKHESILGHSNSAARRLAPLSYYTPTLRTDVSKEDWNRGDDDRNDEDDTPAVIHIVKTRFMQEQGNLTALGESRLALFRVFCLPTMLQQSTQNFLWIIKTDPHLHPPLLRALVQAVQHRPNIYVVSSNVNFRVNENFPGAWRDGAEASDLVRSKVYTGNQTVLEQAMALEGQFPILETRLDADDGLHTQFLRVVQKKAALAWKENPQLEWMYWCSRRHIDWHWMDSVTKPLLHTTHKNKKNHNQPTIHSKPLLNMMYSFGAIQGVTHSRLCVTPGITTGFALGTREKNVPNVAHHLLVKTLRGPVDNINNNSRNESSPNCGLPNTADCLQFIESLVFEAIRSRSPTSAGMLDIHPDATKLYDTWWVNYVFWNMVHESFGIRRDALEWMNSYLSEHLIDIAKDNLLGQCTSGHSCKESAKKDLERLVASRNITFTIDME